MYGKTFSSKYTGSMIGSGAIFFAVWDYVITEMRPDKVVGAQVELNPKLLAFIFGESEDDIEGAIRKMCDKDPESRTPDRDGRKLVKLGQFDYQVVNGAKYMDIRNEHERRASNRKRVEKFRKKGKPSPGETAYVRTLETAGQAAADAQMDAAQTNGHSKELSATEQADLQRRQELGLA
jgi:hypothetical protein